MQGLCNAMLSRIRNAFNKHTKIIKEGDKSSKQKQNK